MDLFLFYPDEYHRRYSCQNVSVESVPLSQRRSVVLGSITLFLFFVYHLLYIPCLLSFWKRLGDSSCYKILFYIGITDVFALWITGFETGLFGLLGWVFCSAPTLIYFSGVMACAVWGAETTAEALLALDRCVDVISPKFSDILFKGKRTVFWLIAITFYAFCWLFWATPALFSGIHFSWFFDPYVGGFRNMTAADEPYICYFDAIHNLAIAGFLPLVYGSFIVIHFAKKTLYTEHTRITKMDLLIILQVFLISVLNFFAATLFILMQHIQVTESLILAAQFSWFHVHGFPPVIYLLLNKTCRTDCRNFFLRLFRPGRISRVHGVTMVFNESRNKIGTANEGTNTREASSRPRLT